MSFKRSNMTTALRARWMTADNLKEWHEGTLLLLRQCACPRYVLHQQRMAPDLCTVLPCTAVGWERNAIELGQGYYSDTEREFSVVGPNGKSYKVKTKFVYFPGQAIYHGNADESSVNDADEATGRSNIAGDASLGPVPAKPKNSGQHWTLNAGMLLGGYELRRGAEPNTARFVKPVATPWQVRGARFWVCGQLWHAVR